MEDETILEFIEQENPVSDASFLDDEFDLMDLDD